MAKQKFELRPGVDVFTLNQLLEKVAALKKTTLVTGSRDAYTEPLETYELDDALQKYLRERGYSTDMLSADTFALFAPSHRDDFKPRLCFGHKEGNKEFDLRIEARAAFGRAPYGRGFTIRPRVHGTSGGGYDEQRTHHFFKRLAEFSEAAAPPLLRELADSESGTIYVSWTELGLGGIRQIAALFAEFAGGNQRVLSLGRQGVFHPVWNEMSQPGEMPYVVEHKHIELFNIWGDQLEEYRGELHVATR